MNTNSSTLSKVLSGINNTLSIANKALPIVKEARPIINTAKETINTFKSTSTDLKKMYKLIKVKNQIKKDMTKNTAIKKVTSSNISSTYSNTNNPTFFI